MRREPESSKRFIKEHPVYDINQGEPSTGLTMRIRALVERVG